MRKQWLGASLGLFLVLGAIGCHADENDPAGQSEELSDPVRRQHAIENLRRIYSKALADNGGDRDNPAVRAVADAAIENMTNAYVQNREDSQAGLALLELMHEMRDTRSLPALVAALDWERDLSEQHAVTAAQTIADMEIPADKRAEVVQALVASFNEVRDARPVDIRIMDATIRALGSFKTHDVTQPLVDIMLTQRENKPFLINRLAGIMLGEIEDEAAVPALIKALFLFDPQNPAIRLEDVATGALVRIGRPALQPLLDLLNGRNTEANELAGQIIAAMAERDPSVRQLFATPQDYARERAVVALGALGLKEALDPLLAEAQSDSPRRRLTGAVMLVQLNLEPAQESRVRETLIRVHDSLSKTDFQELAMRAQLVSAMQHTFNPGYLDVFLGAVRDRDLHPDIRLTANTAYALLANKAEAARLRQVIAQEPSSASESEDDAGGYRERFQEAEPALAAADACDMDQACWVGKLGDANVLVVRKAIFMLGRLGRCNEQAITALIGKLDHRDAQVRLDALYALDTVANSGSQAAVDRIGALRHSEEGTAIWRQVGTEAVRVQGRLRARMTGA
jgi:HEAT repeat protein